MNGDGVTNSTDADPYFDWSELEGSFGFAANDTFEVALTVNDGIATSTATADVVVGLAPTGLLGPSPTDSSKYTIVPTHATVAPKGWITYDYAHHYDSISADVDFDGRATIMMDFGEMGTWQNPGASSVELSAGGSGAIDIAYWLTSSHYSHENDGKLIFDCLDSGEIKLVEDTFYGGSGEVMLVDAQVDDITYRKTTEPTTNNADSSCLFCEIGAA